MNCNKIIVSLFLVSLASAVMAMNQEFKSPETIARTFSCEYPSQGILLVPKVIEQYELEQLFQELYPRREQGRSVLLMPQVLKDRAFEQEFYRRKDAGGSKKELLSMHDAFKNEQRKKYWDNVQVSQKYQTKKYEKNDETSDCCRLFLECFEMKK